MSGAGASGQAEDESGQGECREHGEGQRHRHDAGQARDSGRTDPATQDDHEVEQALCGVAVARRDQRVFS
jgi:hypothetical protein